MQVKESTWYRTKSGEKAYVVGFDKVNGFWTGSVETTYSKTGISALWNGAGYAQVPDYQLVEEWHEPETIVGWIRLTGDESVLGRRILFPTKSEAAKDIDGKIHRTVKVKGTEGVE